MLQWFKQKGCEVLGFDPAKGAATEAKKKGIFTIEDFFGAKFLQSHIFPAVFPDEKFPKFDLICGSNVLAHNPNLNDFVEGIRIALKPEGIVTMEFPHLMNLLNGTCQFDTIYHEHYSYLSFMTVCELFKRHGLEVFDVTMTPEQGGSIMIFAQHELKGQQRTINVAKLLKQEREFGMSTSECYHEFRYRVEKAKGELLYFLLDAKQSEKLVSAYGASCKCNTLLNFCGVRPDLIPFVVDRSPLKQGKYLPGSHIPIYDEDTLMRERPDYVLITAWNLKEEIMKQLEYIREWGGQFVMTTPELEVL
jgi:SAM-dependent methyltransferase